MLAGESVDRQSRELLDLLDVEVGLHGIANAVENRILTEARDPFCNIDCGDRGAEHPDLANFLPGQHVVDDVAKYPCARGSSQCEDKHAKDSKSEAARMRSDN